jgi:hypothetical protein
MNTLFRRSAHRLLDGAAWTDAQRTMARVRAVRAHAILLSAVTDIDLEEKESCCCGACDSGPDQHAGRYYMEPLNSSWSHQLTPPTGRIVAAQCLCRCARAAGAGGCMYFSFLRGAATATAAKREGRGRGADRRQTPAHDRFNRTRAHCPT